MSTIFHKIAIQSLLKKIDNDIYDEPIFEILKNENESNSYFTTDSSHKEELKVFDENILSYGFRNIGILRQINVKKKLIRDVYQKIYLSPSQEMICSLGLMQIAYQNVPYIAFISQSEKGKYYLYSGIKTDLKMNETERVDYKFHRSVSNNKIDISANMTSHILSMKEEDPEIKLKQFLGIEDGIRIEKDLYRRNLIRTLKLIRDDKNSLKWYYRKFIDENENLLLKNKINDILNKIENAV